MKTIMLDSGVVYDIQKHEREAMQKLSDFNGYALAISYLVYIEVMAAAQMRLKKDTAKFLRRFAVYPFDSKAQEVGRLYARKYFTGKENWQMDLLIAAHAKALNLPIITNNAKDFIFKDAEVIPYRS